MFKIGSINDLLQNAGQYIKQRAVQDTERLADLNDGFWGGVANASRYVDDTLNDVGESVYSTFNGRRFAPGEFASSFRNILDSGAQALGNAASKIDNEINRGAAANRMRRGVDIADYDLDDFQKTALDIARSQFGLSDFAAHLAATSKFNPRVLQGYLDEGELRVLEESYRLGKGAVMGQEAAIKQQLAQELRQAPRVQDVFTGGYNTAPDFEAEMFQQLGTQQTSRANAQDLQNVLAGQSAVAPSRNPEVPIRYFDELDTYTPEDMPAMSRPDFSNDEKINQFRKQSELEKYLNQNYVRTWR